MSTENRKEKRRDKEVQEGMTSKVRERKMKSIGSNATARSKKRQTRTDHWIYQHKCH